MTEYDKYIGLKFKHQGRDFDGVDCFGIPFLMFNEEKGIELPDFLDLKYGVNWSKEGKNHILENISDQWEVIETGRFKKFDIHLFRDENLILSHMGVNIGNGKFIHVIDGRESVIGKLSVWKSRLHATVRYIGNGKDNI